MKPLLAVRTAPGPDGLRAEVHLLLPATGCLHCTGGADQPASPPWPENSPIPRSWHGVAAHAGLRMLEQMYGGRMHGPVVRQLTETEDGGLQVQDRHMAASARLRCPLCLQLQAAGLGAVRSVIDQRNFSK